MTDPMLWYLNRSSGAVLLLALSLTVTLGLLSPGGRPARGVPRFVTQTLHRRVAALSTALLAGHVVTAVVDEFVDIRWWQVVSPVGATYQPLWLGLGAVAVDLLLVIVLTSLMRSRLRPRTWRLLHQLAWPMWGLSLAHGIGIGTDLRSGWWWVVLTSAGLVAAGLAFRAGLALVDVLDRRRVGVRLPEVRR